MASIGLTGCSATTQTWSYAPTEPGFTAAVARADPVDVILNADHRSSEVFDIQGIVIGVGVPCGWITYERPEAARGNDAMFPTKTAPRGVRYFEMDLARDLPAAIAHELRRANLFPAAAFDPAGARRPGAWTVEVEIHRFAWTVYNWTYGLSVFGGIPAYFGAPYATSRVRMDVALLLRDPAGAAVWSGPLKYDETRNHRLYHNYGFDIGDFAAAVQRGMPKAAAEMAKAPASRGGPATARAGL